MKFSCVQFNSVQEKCYLFSNDFAFSNTTVALLNHNKKFIYLKFLSFVNTKRSGSRGSIS